MGFGFANDVEPEDGITFAVIRSGYHYDAPDRTWQRAFRAQKVADRPMGLG
jgi:hypothetical protein